MNRHALALGLLALVAAPPAARADDEVAKKYYELGRTLYSRSDYEGAIKQFEEAYRLSRKPDLLYNIARSHEALGQYEKAIEVYRTYLTTQPPAAQGEVSARIANMERLAERQRRERESAPAPRRSSLPGWLTVGAGGALLATGAAFAGLAMSRKSQVEERIAAGADYASFADLDSQGRRFQTAGIALLAAGGAVAATGVVLLVLRSRSGAAGERRAWLAPTVAAGQAGLAAGFRY